jgi:hypothetical protein
MTLATCLKRASKRAISKSGKVFHRTGRLFLGNFRREPKKTKKANDIPRRAMKWYGNHSR